MSALKGPTPQHHDGSGLRIGIVHARWNSTIIEPLLQGAREQLLSCGVKESNIVVHSVPGSWELPIAVQRLYTAAITASSKFGEQPFDALIAIGVLIKGETMHFEYIADAVSHGLMKVQLEHGVPVIFGVLTVLNDEQAKARAGLIQGNSHNHGTDWGLAAVEMGVRNKAWAEGRTD